MSVNKAMLPELDSLEKEVKTDGIDKVVSHYINADVLIGPSDSIEYIKKLIKDFKIVKDGVV